GGVVSSITGGRLGNLAAPILSIVGFIGGVFSRDVLRGIITPNDLDEVCHTDGYVNLAIRSALNSAFGGWFGTVPRPTLRAYEYELNYACPNIIPTPAELDSLFTRGYITQDAWRNA